MTQRKNAKTPSHNSTVSVLSDEQVDVLMDVICAGEEFALLRETLRLYAEEILVSETIH